MTDSQPELLFTLYRWANPKTTCEYPFLVLTHDGSTVLSLGNYLPEDTAGWLARDFQQLGVADV